VQHLPQLRVGRVALHVPLLAELAQRGHLALLEVGLGEDLAVDLHQHLFDDLRPWSGDNTNRGEREPDERGAHGGALPVHDWVSRVTKAFDTNILHLFGERAQELADALEYSA